jgi:arsenical pump membrane protein
LLSVQGAAAETIGLVLLGACLVGAIARPRGLSEAVVAVPAALITIALGITSVHRAGDVIDDLGTTVAFLAAILAFGNLCAEAGVFGYLAGVAAERSRGQARRLLTMFVVIAALVTATLTLDAAVVLLTPVVITTAAALAVPARPHAYACVQLANAGSLLLPVSNLTNLLAFNAAGVSFAHFTAVMALPWIAAVGIQGYALHRFFRADLDTPERTPPARPACPTYALSVLAATVAGFVVASAADVPPAWAALGGVLLLAVPRLAADPAVARRTVAAANVGFCLFVFALGVVVDGVVRHGLGRLLAQAIPSGSGLLTMLAVAALAAALANVANNLPATLVLLPLTTGRPLVVLAVLIGVNVGPNLTYVGSLATLLWRRILPRDQPARAATFHRYGAWTVAPTIVAATALLWLGGQWIG